MASNDICEFQGKWHLLLDKSDSLDQILTGLRFGWLKKKALRNFAPTTYIRLSDRACYGSQATYEAAIDSLQAFLPKEVDEAVEIDHEEYDFDDEEWEDDDGSEDDLGNSWALAEASGEELEGMKISIVRAAAAAMSSQQQQPRKSLYMYMKTLFPWHNVKEGVVEIDGLNFEHHDSDTGLWRSAVTFRDGRVYQKRVSEEYGTMYDIRAIFKPPFAPADLEVLTADDSRLLNLTTWTGFKPLMLFKWTLVAPDGQVYSCVRWNEKLVFDPTDQEDLAS